MIDAIYLDPVYWAGVAALVVVSTLLTRSRPLGFRFVCLVLLSQYVVHALIAFGAQSPVAAFCMASFVLFVVASLPAVGRMLGARASGPLGSPEAVRFTARFARVWFHVSRLFLLGYWAVRLVTYPFSTGDLDMTDRLVAQQDDRAIFFLAQVTLPALAACMAVWLRRGRRLTWVDLAALLLTVVGLIGSDSKATLLPIALAFFGALELTGRRLRDFKRFAVPAAVLAALGVGRLLLYFPKQGPLGVADTMLYRIAANTDSLEYLATTRHAPGDFPFAGLPGLIPYISKVLGYRYDYSPGVWLYGERYGDFSGYGPNSGPVLDYFGNIGWAGLIVVLLAALVLNLLRGRASPEAVGAASVVYLTFVDVTLLDLPVLFWGAVAVLVGILCSRSVSGRLDQLGPLRRLTALGRRLDAPLPGLARRRARHRAPVERATATQNRRTTSRAAIR